MQRSFSMPPQRSSTRRRLPPLSPARSLMSSPANQAAIRIRAEIADLVAPIESTAPSEVRETPTSSEDMFAALRRRLHKHTDIVGPFGLRADSDDDERSPSNGGRASGSSSPWSSPSPSGRPSLRSSCSSPIVSALSFTPLSSTARRNVSTKLRLDAPLRAHGGNVDAHRSDSHGEDDVDESSAHVSSRPLLGDVVEIEALLADLASALCFSGLSMTELKSLCSAASIEAHPKHTVLYREGTRSSWLGILLAGSIAYTDSGGTLHRISRTESGPPMLFGEEGGLGETLPRFGTAVTVSDDVTVVTMPRGSLPPALLGVVRSLLIARLLQASRGIFSAQQPESDFVDFAACCELRSYARGAEVMKEGDVAKDLFVLSSGQLQVSLATHSVHAPDVVLGTIDASLGCTYVGESVLADRLPHMPPKRTATVRAASETCWLLRIEKRYLPRLMHLVPQLQANARLMHATLQAKDNAVRAQMTERDAILRVVQRLESAVFRTTVEARMQLHNGTSSTAKLPLLKARLISVLNRSRSKHTAASAQLNQRATVVLGPLAGLGRGISRLTRMQADAAFVEARITGAGHSGRQAHHL